jgi:hypothetical protein
VYAAPFDLFTRLGWVAAAVVLLVLAVRAVRVEVRHARSTPRSRGVRIADAGLDVVTTLAVAAFATVLVLVVYSTFLGWMR